MRLQDLAQLYQLPLGVADLVLEMGGAGRAEKKPEDELVDLKDALRREYPRQAESLIRKGKAPRR
jgi:hypothetical protein